MGPGLNNDAQMAMIIERCIVAIDEKRRIEAANKDSHRILGMVPPWFGVLSAIVVVLIGFGTLRADVATAKDQAEANKDTIAAMAPKLATIEANVNWLVAESKERRGQ